MRRLLLSSFELPLLYSDILDALGFFFGSYLLENFLFSDIDRGVGLGAVDRGGTRYIRGGVGSRHLVNCVPDLLKALGCVIMWLGEVEFGEACEQRRLELWPASSRMWIECETNQLLRVGDDKSIAQICSYESRVESWCSESCSPKGGVYMEQACKTPLNAQTKREWSSCLR